MSDVTPAGDAEGRDRFCGAKKRQGEGNCRRPAGWGTSHPGIGRCKLHGGSTPDQVKHANGQKAAAAVVTFGLPREVNPQVALLEEVHRTAGIVAFLDRELAASTVEQLVGERAAWVALHQAERAHAVKVAKAAIDAGIAEREVRLAEEQGHQIATVLRDVLADAMRWLLAQGIAADLLGRLQAEVVPGIVRARLLEVVAAE